MRTDRELLADALKLIEYGIRGGEAHDITEEIRAHLAEPEDDPVAWISEQGVISKYKNWEDADPLYRHPPRPAEKDVNLYGYTGPILEQLTEKPMNQLLDAAKAVIHLLDFEDYCGTVGECEAVNRLIKAVERAEKQEAVGFEEWWDANADLKYKFVPIGQAKQLWNAASTAAQQAERKRIRARAQIAAEKVWRAGDWYIGPQHYLIEQFVDALLEDGDDE